MHKKHGHQPYTDQVFHRIVFSRLPWGRTASAIQPAGRVIRNGVCQKIRHTDFDHREPGESRALCARYFSPAGSSRQSLHVHAIGCSSTPPATRAAGPRGKGPTAGEPGAGGRREGVHRAPSTSEGLCLRETNLCATGAGASEAIQISANRCDAAVSREVLRLVPANAPRCVGGICDGGRLFLVTIFIFFPLLIQTDERGRTTVKS